MTLTAVDLFCGAGGLSEGLSQSGVRVLGALDVSRLAIEAYRANHPDTRVWRRDIRRLAPVDILRELGLRPGELDLLAGCPPCQGFSTLRTHNRSSHVNDSRNGLVAQFARFCEVLRPRGLLMENVPGLESDRRFRLLMNRLERLGYQLTYGVLDAADYGVPQRRRRFVLLGLLGEQVEFASPTATPVRVRDAIGDLPQPTSSDDPLHNYREARSREILELIRDIPSDGGSRRDLGPERQLACHKRVDGWNDVYGRMAWDAPAPTITSGCINPSKGRFLHPEEDRAITLREAALLQSFPHDYEFPLTEGRYKAADLIGNALPPVFVAQQVRPLINELSR
jgi:DNA (cytosine-5)-methyltransferase 1